MKYRKKPVVIEARQWDGTPESSGDIGDWIGWGNLDVLDGRTPPQLSIETLEGWITASIGDWIIRGVQGEFYPCKPDIFDATYEAVQKEET